MNELTLHLPVLVSSHHGSGESAIPGALLLHTAAELFVILAFLAVAALLVAHGRRQDRALGRVFTLLAAFVACIGLRVCFETGLDFEVGFVYSWPP